MWTIHLFAQFYALFCVTTLLLAFFCHEVAGHHGSPGSHVTLNCKLLLSLRTSTKGDVLEGIPAELYSTYSLDKIPSHRNLRRRGGRRGGVSRRPKRLSLDNRRQLPPLPTVLLSNVQSIRNKVDKLEVWAKFKQEIKETCL